MPQHDLLKWDIFEIESDAHTLHGVKMRGRVRKYTIDHGLTCLVENATDKHNVVRFALLSGHDPEHVMRFVHSIAPNDRVAKVADEVANPVLSKITINDPSRYEI